MTSIFYREWEKASLWMEEGRRVAIASVIQTWGSSPRPVGSILAIREDELFEGSVSGGCVEGAVIVEAVEAIKTGEPKTLNFQAGENDIWSPGLSCGGKISIYINPVWQNQGGFIEKTFRYLKNQTPVTLVTKLDTGEVYFFGGDNPETLKNRYFPPPLAEAIALHLKKRFSSGVEVEGKDYFIQVITPLPRLFVFGAVHIAQSLVPMARMVGFEVILVDPREAFAEDARFYEENIITEWPGDFLDNQKLTPDCAVVTLTHDPKLDDPVLQNALKSNCLYIGALGSRETQKIRKNKLKTLGFPEKQIRRISGPVGLPIGALTPQEISISILAELVQVFRERQAG